MCDNLSFSLSPFRYRIIREVSPYTRNVTIDSLEPNVNYELVIIALFESPVNASIPSISQPLSSLQTSTPNYPKEFYKFYQHMTKSSAQHTGSGKFNHIQGTDDRMLHKSRESASEAIRFISPDIGKSQSEWSSALHVSAILSPPPPSLLLLLLMHSSTAYLFLYLVTSYVLVN